MAKRNLKLNFYGFLGFLGFMGFQDPWYFFFFLFFLFFVAPTPKNSDLIEKQAQEKQGHLQKIKDYIAGRNKINNHDVQKLLGVSDATAERYLNELEKQGVLRQKGQYKGVFYEKIG
jgi:predicted HTH transcriptional regulator